MGWRPQDDAPPPKPKSRPPPAERIRGAKSGTRPIGHVAKNKLRWLKVTGFEVALFMGYDNPDRPRLMDHEEVGKEPLKLLIRRTGASRPWTIALTQLTTDELKAMKDFIVDAIDRALPVVEVLDAQAVRNKEEKHETTLARLYRSAPQLFDRSGDE